MKRETRACEGIELTHNWLLAARLESANYFAKYYHRFINF